MLILFDMINSFVCSSGEKSSYDLHMAILPPTAVSALGTSSHLRERLGVVRQRKLPLSLQGVFFKGYNL